VTRAPAISAVALDPVVSYHVDHQAELGNVAPALARLLVEIERRRRAPTDAAANHSNHEVDA
jgi:hypothetical protein